MAALADLPRVIFNRVLEQMQSYKISSFLHDMTMAPNGTINNASTTDPLQAAGSAAGERKSKGFLDSSSIYTSGYALGLALMVSCQRCLHDRTTLLITCCISVKSSYSSIEYSTSSCHPGPLIGMQTASIMNQKCTTTSWVLQASPSLTL